MKFSHLVEFTNFILEKLDIEKVSDIKISDTQMYMQTGNSITVKVLEYIFKNLFISEVEKIKKENK